jgi:cytochrome c oxidase subunit 4
LAAVTGIELVLVYLPFNIAFVYSVLIALSLFKFIAVIAWFMHLIYDKLILTLAFGTGMAIATGTYTALLFLLGSDRVAPVEIPGIVPM